MSQSILYYPNINIQDSAWLRGATLYWDEVCSIVPSHDFTGLSDKILKMEEKGMYRRIYPESVLWLDDSNEFIEKIERRFEKMLKNEGAYLRRLHNKKVYAGDEHSLIHINKIPPEFRKKLDKMGLTQHDDNTEWIRMDSILSDIYMRTLAEFVAANDKEDMVLGTDNNSKLNYMYKKSWNEERDLMFSLTLVQCLPMPALDTDFEKIINFKEKRQDDLLELRIKIREVERKIKESESKEEIKAIIADFQESWEREIRRSELLFQGDKIGFTLDNFETYIASIGGAVGLLSGLQTTGIGNISPIITSATIGMAGLVTLGAQCRKYKKKIREQQDGGFAYIIGAAKENLLRKYGKNYFRD